MQGGDPARGQLPCAVTITILRIQAFITAFVLVGACIGSKDWHIGAILGPIACWLCFTYGYFTGSDEKSKQLWKIWRRNH